MKFCNGYFSILFSCFSKFCFVDLNLCDLIRFLKQLFSVNFVPIRLICAICCIFRKLLCCWNIFFCFMMPVLVKKNSTGKLFQFL
jgi:hypothetical protein